MNARPVTKITSWLKFLGKNLHLVSCATLCAKSKVMLLQRYAPVHVYENLNSLSKNILPHCGRRRGKHKQVGGSSIHSGSFIGWDVTERFVKKCCSCKNIVRQNLHFADVLKFIVYSFLSLNSDLGLQ